MTRSSATTPRSRLLFCLAAVVLAIALALGGIALMGGGDDVDRVRRGAEVPATAMDRTIEPANNSPLLLADPTEPRFVVLANRLDAPDFDCALQVSGDGGKGWVPADPVPHLPKGAEKCYAPEVAFDRAGKLYYLFVGLSGRGNEPMGVFLTTSADRGRTFTLPHRVLGPLNFAVRMAIDPGIGRSGRLHLVWLKSTSDPPLGGFAPSHNPILAAHSDDGGRSFSKPVQVSDPDRKRVVAPALALGRDHAVHVAYYDLGRDAVDYQGLEGPAWKGRWSLVMASSFDGGTSFGTFHRGVVDDGIVPSERVLLIFTMPPASMVANGQRVCLGWTDARNGDADVLSRCSQSQGRRWERPRRVNDDTVGNGLSQYMPRLALAPGGRLDAIFYDRRRNPENIGTDVMYASSKDGGRHFARNVRLNRETFDSRIGPQYANASAQGRYEFGSRLGLLARADDAVAAWADTHNSLPLGKAQDTFSTTIDLHPSNHGLAQPKDPRVPLPKAAPVVVAAMREYRFDYRPPNSSGRVVFRFVNKGRVIHRPALIALTDDIPPIRQQVRGTKRRSVRPFGGVYDRRPGATGTFAVNLVAGRRYALICYAQAPDGSSHAQKGMADEFRTP